MSSDENDDKMMATVDDDDMVSITLRAIVSGNYILFVTKPSTTRQWLLRKSNEKWGCGEKNEN